ncbi:MAG: cytochrome P450 [Chloroflexota bacterium]
MTQSIPFPDGPLAWRGLQAYRQQGHIFAALQVFHQELGDIFRFRLPGLNFVMMAGPEANRMLLVSNRNEVRWRTDSDPISQLLGDGLLVSDGTIHDESRQIMNPAVHKQALERYVDTMWRYTDQVALDWTSRVGPVEMLAEMRKVAILILMDTLFSVDYNHEMVRLWQAIMKMLQFISPGLWLLFPKIPRPQYRPALQQMNRSINNIVRTRRAAREKGQESSLDLLDLMLDAGMNDTLIRDQILTMFIAGHDTSTALLAWALYLLGNNPSAFKKAQKEVDTVLGNSTPTMANLANLRYLGFVIDESLRLYPPAHIGSRVTLTDLEFQGHYLPPETRLMYSIYLTHRDPKEWDQPNEFIPERFESEGKRAYTPYAYLPFGGGPRNCIGAAFGQVEAKVVLARILQTVDLQFVGHPVTPKMAVTLEPAEGIRMNVRQRPST